MSNNIPYFENKNINTNKTNILNNNNLNNKFNNNIKLKEECKFLRNNILFVPVNYYNYYLHKYYDKCYSINNY